MNDRVHIKAMLPGEAEELVVKLGERKYRARQILEWIHARSAGSWGEMTNIPSRLKDRLAGMFELSPLAVEEIREGEGGIRKILFSTAEGFPVESVLMPKGRFLTACISSQSGCPLSCAFCATGRLGFKRNLSAGEIVDQAARLSALAGAKLTHIVLMGMGEPLLNCDEVFRAVRVFVSPGCMAMSPSRVTLSTAGMVGGLRRLCAEGLKVNVALSLNAVGQALRESLMPAAAANPLPLLLETFASIPASPRNARTLEYVLLRGVNDSRGEAEKLAGIARRIEAKVNLIPFNEVDGIPFKSPTETAVDSFLAALAASGVTATARRSMGSSIGAACGQLAGLRS